MRGFVPEVHTAGGEIVILGNGSPEQAAWFVEDYHIEMPVFTDPPLASHAIVGARKPWMLDPRSLGRSLEAMRHGFRQTKVMGSAMQLGGVFVITADGRMPYKYLSRFAGDHPDPREAVAALAKSVP